VLALPSTLQEGFAIAERLRQALESEPLTASGEEIAVTSSFGVAEAESGRNDALSALLRQADEALYASKRDGRNRVTPYRAPSLLRS